jgi:Ni/Co efflux regulator RcnB
VVKRLLLGIAVIGLFAPIDASAADRGRGDDQRPGAGHVAGLYAKPHALPFVQARKLWRQGERIPMDYLAAQYSIAEPEAPLLPKPAPGLRWINVDGDGYLVHIADGTVEDLVVVGPTDEASRSVPPIIAAEHEPPLVAAVRSAQR